MENIPEVTVVIPAYNAEAYLARAVDSVLVQEGCCYELIIVDNNSSDATARIARDYELRFPGQVRLLAEARPGASAARNAGLASARAPWVQFLDADDVLLPEKLQRQLILVRPDLDWIVGTIRLRSQNGKETDADIATDLWWGLLTYTGLGHLNANLFRTGALRKLGGFNEEYLNCNDFELFFRLVQAGRRYAEDLVPGAVHIHHDGPRITNTNRVEMARRRLELTNRMISHLKVSRPDYFAANRTLINTALLRVIRKQATVDVDTATENFYRYFPGGYRKKDFEAARLPAFLLAYPVLGFGMVERVRLLLASILPSSLKGSS